MCDYSSNEICFTLYFKCVLIVLKCMWLYWPVFIIKRAIGTLQIGIRAIGTLQTWSMKRLCALRPNSTVETIDQINCLKYNTMVDPSTWKLHHIGISILMSHKLDRKSVV